MTQESATAARWKTTSNFSVCPCDLHRTSDTIPIDSRTTCRRLPVSIYCPTSDDSTIADAPRAMAYTDMGSRVPGKMAARYSTLPNSNTRELHVDRKCEAYRRLVTEDGGQSGSGSLGGDGTRGEDATSSSARKGTDSSAGDMVAQLPYDELRGAIEEARVWHTEEEQPTERPRWAAVWCLAPSGLGPTPTTWPEYWVPDQLISIKWSNPN